MLLATFLLPFTPLMAPRPDAPIIGPDWMMVDPTGNPVYYDAGLHQLSWMDGRGVWVPPAEDGLFLKDGSFLLLCDRLLFQYGRDGEPRRSLALPTVAPDGLLGVVGDLVVTLDVFGNGHPVAAVREGALTATEEFRLLPAENRVRSREGGLWVDGEKRVETKNPVGGRILGDWLIVEERRPEGLVRYGIGLKRGERVDLSPQTRLYAPSRDLAAGPDGQLWWMTPTASGLSFREYGREKQ